MHAWSLSHPVVTNSEVVVLQVASASQELGAGEAIALAVFVKEAGSEEQVASASQELAAGEPIALAAFEKEDDSEEQVASASQELAADQPIALAAVKGFGGDEVALLAKPGVVGAMAASASVRSYPAPVCLCAHFCRLFVQPCHL